MCRLCWFLSALFAVSILALVYLFIVRGSVAPGTDGRVAIVLQATERDLILAEMRSFLVAVQGITAAAANRDVAGVARAARTVGVAAQTEMPASLVGKLPLSFKQLGFATHEAFDRLALDAEQLGDTSATPAALGDLLQNCIACHAAYQLTVEAP
jgi:hypothetical protein